MFSLLYMSTTILTSKLTPQKSFDVLKTDFEQKSKQPKIAADYVEEVPDQEDKV